MKNKKELEKLKPKIVKILKEKGIKKAGIFGSFARGEQKENSDIDILIELPENIGGFEFIGIQLEIEKILGRKVDMITYNSINPHLKKYILGDEIKII
jgi:predicted nucleotidyltransferase